ncbi:MAG: hypothetical protein CXT69_01360 [Methanobacteriota archaeon]|nr:MAG: hypothetical protein CXT69_01360 [Euryarchaeota archaeon]HIK79049.1 hypothetical protein [Candidatus Poseidoniales archaeon]
MMIRIGAGIIAIIIVAVVFIGMSGVSDGGDEDAMIPPCDYETSMVPPPPTTTTTCYWGMSEQTLVIPDEAAAADIDVEVSWTKNNVWVGIVEASESDHCDKKDGYFECGKGTVTTIAGGESSGKGFTWSPEPGEYRFLAGGEEGEELQSYTVTWAYDAGLSLVIAGPLLLISAGLAYYAAIGLKRDE